VAVDVRVQCEDTYKSQKNLLVLAIARQCIRFEPKDWPTMAKVVRMLSMDTTCWWEGLDFVQRALKLAITNYDIALVIMILAIVSIVYQ
jgi:hypothetical protein